MIQAEGLYSAFAKEMDIYSFLQFYSGALDVKNPGIYPLVLLCQPELSPHTSDQRGICCHLVSRLERLLPGALIGPLSSITAWS
jgi:hypothetical protein